MRDENGSTADSAVVDVEAFFLEQLGTIDRVVRWTCLRNSLEQADAQEFTSIVMLRLIENDYAIIRKFEARCSFATYVSIVVQRILLDYRTQLWGKWHASAEATRIGSAAVALEALLYRDGRTLEEALPEVRKIEPAVTLERLDRLRNLLPVRTRRPRPVALHGLEEKLGVEADALRGGALERDRAETAVRIGEVVRATIDVFDEEERHIFLLRFRGGLTVAEIARALDLPQKPLYRRVERCLAELRRRLVAAHIDRDDVQALLDSPSADLDFGFGSEQLPVGRSNENGAEGSGEECS